jgi:hypothetical protein
MDSGCPDCWGYNDSHPCLCRGRTDERIPDDVRDAGADVPEIRDPAGASPVQPA